MNTFTMHLHESPFRRIQSGEKWIESRLYDEKRQALEIGDVVEFSLRESDETICKTITSLHRFASFDELFSQYPEERDNNVRQYYSEEDEQKYGVVAIEFGSE